jgi:hypothetical protein
VIADGTKLEGLRETIPGLVTGPVGNTQLEGTDACPGVWADELDAFDSHVEGFLKVDLQ